MKCSAALSTAAVGACDGPTAAVGKAVQAAWEQGVLIAGGGHAMAAGLTMHRARLNDLVAFLHARLAAERVEALADDVLDIDALIEPGGASRDLFEAFEQLAPFGPGNPEPVFALSGVQAREPMQINGGHIRCRLVAPDGGGLRAVAWRCADLPQGRALLSGQGGLSVVGRLKAAGVGQARWIGRDTRARTRRIAQPMRSPGEEPP